MGVAGGVLVALTSPGRHRRRRNRELHEHRLADVRAHAGEKQAGDAQSELMLATERGDAAAVARLLDGEECEVGWKDSKGRTVLMLAARQGDPLVTRQLLDATAAVDERDSEGETALTIAAGFGSVAVVRQLLEAGADVNARNGR